MGARESLRGVARVGGLVVLVAAYAGLTPVLAGRVPGPTLALALAVMGLVLALCQPRPRSPLGTDCRAPDRSRCITAAAGGALSLFLGPCLVLVNRYSDAPSGSETLLFATVGWGAIAALVAAGELWLSGERVRAWAVRTGVLAAVVGCAGVLASWERPSSFSPLVRFVPEEVWMLVGGCAFVAGVLLLRRSARGLTGPPWVVAAGAATTLALAVWLADGRWSHSVSSMIEYGPVLGLWALCGAGMWVAWTRETLSRGLLVPAAAFFLPPALLSLLSVVERLVGAWGPEPVLWPGIAGGALVSLAGIARIVSWRGIGASSPPGASSRALAWYAILVSGGAAASLLLPALSARVTGSPEGRLLDISWTLPGWESIGGWIALSLGLLLLAAIADGSLPAILTAMAATPAYWLLSATPTHSMNRWLPIEIQQYYGSEYVDLVFRPLAVWPARVAVAGVATGLAIVLTRRLLKGRSGMTSEVPL
jgi:hypothetical protein